MQKIYKCLSDLHDSDLLFLVNIFLDHNVPLYCVGGAIRDIIMFTNKHIEFDIDCAVPIEPQKTISILQENNIKHFSPGLEFGTVIAHLNGKNYEITSFRQDIETDGRYVKVRYSNNMYDDAQRRDFTMNALYYDPKQKVILDPLECGYQDAKDRKVKFIGDAHQRIQEDYLRILRYFRFLAHYSLNDYQSDIFKSSDYTQGLLKLSSERIRQELLKIITGPYAVQVLEEIVSLGYGEYIFKNLKFSFDTFNEFKNVTSEHKYFLPSLFFSTDPKDIKNNKIFTKKEKKQILEFRKVYDLIYKYLEIDEWVKLCDLQYNHDPFIWKVLLVINSPKSHRKTLILKAIVDNPLPKFTQTGDMLIAEGFQQGKQISDILRQRRFGFIKEYLISCLPQFFGNIP